MAAKKFVYFFGNGKADGRGDMKDLLGGKGAGLAEMTNAGIPVPPGFTITTEVCSIYYTSGKKLPADVSQEIDKNLAKLESSIGKKLGDVANPLLVSVRSGAKFSMPGMMDTVLNLGLNDNTINGLIAKSGNERFAWDAYRRFIQMFGNVVMGIEKDEFEHILQSKKDARKIQLDVDLNVEDLKEIAAGFKKKVKSKTGQDFPQDAHKQLRMAEDAVFNSWNNPRAITYRRLNDIPANLGTAVNVQAMVFGNMGETSATGVGFTRNPSTGVKEFYGEYLTNAQGEDVVAGIRTPHPIIELQKEMPRVYKQLREITSRLERHYRDVQDFEFTIEDGTLFMLQTRTGKRTAQAAVKIAVDMVKEKLITREEAILRVEPSQLDQLLHPMIDPKAKKEVIAKGLTASPGVAVGKAVFTADDAVTKSQMNEEDRAVFASLTAKQKAEFLANRRVILVRTETNPDDIHGMDAAAGILTKTGGMLSHAAVVARGMGTPCVAGCESIRVDEKGGKFTAGGVTVKEGDWITIDGSTGEVMLGAMPTIEPNVKRLLAGEFGTLMGWADKARTLKVRANADIPRDAKVAVQFGAEGIGLCRTEHMFFAEDRLPHVQAMILADNVADREKSLAELLPMQRADFLGLFQEMNGRPVTIRLLDPPLHEFLPKREELMVEIAVMKAQKKDATPKYKKLSKVLARVEDLHEFNPMLGHRGCRLGIVYPEITRMQARAIFEAAAILAKKRIKVIPEVMVPLVGMLAEFTDQKSLIIEMADAVMKEQKVKIQYMVGTMIELPRAALMADEIAKEAEFFSFGTNDLTQTTFGFSRDDAGKFITKYMETGIMEKDPFVTLDQEGVGQLVKMGVEKGRASRPGLKVGICGEHGGDPASVEFCHRIGLDYVSCSPYRVPIARMAAAHAAIKEAGKTAASVTK